MVVSQLQELLAGIYDLPLGYDVSDFVFSDRRRLPEPARSTPTDEQVLVLEDGDAAAIGVFLDAALLQRLRAANPLETLHAGNLADYWTALEGVSHFLYLAWHATHDRAVTRLELEMQAEVDKYVASVWLLRAQDPARFPAELHRLLFERAHVDERLAGEHAATYREANQYAARFCRHLERQLRPVAPNARARALTELRRFYRWSNERKLTHIRHSP